jgi:glycosyltransferase involved in cell wall biosynthesis
VKVAQVSPLYESVPPSAYGGTERVVSYLTEELVAQGHEVTLFATGDSHTSAMLAPMYPAAIRGNGDCVDQVAPHISMVEEVLARRSEFDVIHWHIDYTHYAASKRLSYPHLTTLHGRLDIPELPPLYSHFRDEPLVSISMSQRRPLSDVSWVGNVYHGLPTEPNRLQNEPADYLAFVGRISQEKRVDRAIEIALAVNMPLKIAAKIDPNDKEYYAGVKQQLEHPLVEYLGELDETDKLDLMANARVLLFPIDWPEPFGMVMIEAMSVGTPVVAWRNGSVPEVIDEGVSGYIVESISDAAAAVGKAAALDRRAVRRCFEQRFSAQRMASDYVRIYEQLTGRENGQRTASTVAAGNN